MRKVSVESLMLTGHIFCRWIIYPFLHGRSRTKSCQSFMIYGKKLYRRDHYPATLRAWNQTSGTMALGTNILYHTQRFSMLVSCSKWLLQHNLWETRWIRFIQEHVFRFVKNVSCVNYLLMLKLCCTFEQSSIQIVLGKLV